MSNKEIKVGDIVRYIGKEHNTNPEVSPPVGTLGKVLRETRTPDSVLYFIQWEKGSTSDDDCWYQYPEEVELVEDIKVGKTGKREIIAINNTDMPNEAIWEFLKPKMEKNGLTYLHYGYDGDGEKFYYYKDNDVHNAIALAYRSGYLRAMKGRPFMVGEKKKKSGHWEPVNPNNLPKEGTRVRYSRECKEYKAYKNTLVVLGDLGKVDITPEGWFGIRLDNPRSSYSWLSFHDDGIASCLDMWVEDDE